MENQIDSISKAWDGASQYADSLRDVLTPRHTERGGRIMNTGFRRIPSVVSFEVSTKDANPLLENTGLERKMPASYEWKIHESNNAINKYIKYKLKRMQEALDGGNPKLFWAMALEEMKLSRAFRMSAFNTVFHGWYKDMEIKQVIHCLYTVNKILKRELTDMRYFRVFIPKGTNKEILEYFAKNPQGKWPGKMRPLGVPTAPWRVILHMWNNFLVMFLQTTLKRFNHAYMPGRGTNTALRDWVMKVLDAKYVYEFDIKGFFNNVSIHGVIEDLRQRGMDEKALAQLANILAKAPNNLKFHEHQEDLYDTALSLRNYYEMTNLKKDLRDFPPGSNRTWRYHMIQARQNYRNVEPSARYKTPRDMSLDQVRVLAQGIIYKGLPQGAAPSTVLSLLALSAWEQELRAKGISLLMYADDGFLYSDKPFEVFPPRGFELAEEKSRWCKINDTAVVESTKFLGVRYSYATSLLQGATREGSTLEFGKAQLHLLKLVADHTHYTNLMKVLVNSGIWGLTLSKLYGGKFGKLEYTAKASYNKGSYWDRHHDLYRLKHSSKLQRVASTIACAWLVTVVDGSMNKKSYAWLKKQFEFWKDKREPKLTIRDLGAALEWENTWRSDESKVEAKSPVTEQKLEGPLYRDLLASATVRAAAKQSLSKNVARPSSAEMDLTHHLGKRAFYLYQSICLLCNGNLNWSRYYSDQCKREERFIAALCERANIPVPNLDMTLRLEIFNMLGRVSRRAASEWEAHHRL